MNKKKREIDRAAGSLAWNQPKNAIKLIDEYLSEVDSSDIDMLILKGKIFSIMKKFKLAGDMARKALQIDPENTQALIDLGDYYLETLRRYCKALNYYNRALRLIEAGGFYLD